mgnify:CR=1 FL=1|jgi:hypothetical protein
MDPIQALDMLSQVVKGARLPYGEHVLLERSVDVLRTAITAKADTSEEEEPVVFEEPAKSKTPRRGERRKK